jgi:hypothetical protein
MQDIIDWLVSDMDYSSGVDVFGKYCRNKFYVRNLKNSSAKYSGKKLEYEMKRLLGIPMNVISSQKCSNQQLINEHVTVIPNEARHERSGGIPNLQSKKQTDNNNVIPEIIDRAKEMLKDLNTEIALIHNQLYDLGESNDAKTVKRRKKLLDKRIPLIDKYEKLYQLKEEFFLTKLIPEALKLIMTDIHVSSVENTKTQHEQLSDIELVQKQKTLSSNLTKWKNKLNYQSDVAQKEKNPMPEGPKRKQAEAKLKELEKDYNEVIQIIKKRK